MQLRYAAAMAGLALGLMSGSAKAAYVFDVYQSGSNVLAYGSGSLNFTDLTIDSVLISHAVLSASQGELLAGYLVGDVYGNVTGPANFGSGSEIDSTNTTGYLVGVDGSLGLLVVPAGIESGKAIGVSTADFGVGTLAGFGLDPGSYVYSWGTGANADTLTINVGTTPAMSNVPLPSSAPMFGAALVALGAVGYGLKRKSKATA